MEYYSQRDVPYSMAATIAYDHAPDLESLDPIQAKQMPGSVFILQSAAYFIGNLLNTVIIERITRWRGSIEPPY
jgi:hypothetical protein